MTADRLSGRLFKLRKELGSSYMATVRVTARGVRLVATWSPRYHAMLDDVGDEQVDVKALHRLKKSSRVDYIG